MPARHRVLGRFVVSPWGWRMLTQWWTVPYGLYLILTAADPAPVYPGLDSTPWDVVLIVAGLLNLLMAIAPRNERVRYAATFTTAAGCMSRSFALILTGDRVPWVGAGAWAVLAVSYVALVGLSWWALVHEPDK